MQSSDIEPVTVLLENGSHSTGTREIAAFEYECWHARRLRPDPHDGKREIRSIYPEQRRIEIEASWPS